MGERGILKASPLTIDGTYFSCQLRALVKFQHGKMGKKGRINPAKHQSCGKRPN